MDGRGLSEFYDSPMGQRTRRLILRRLRQFWPNPKGRRVLGYGFTRPYLRAFLPEAERCIAAVPVSLGVVPAWPKEKCLTTLTEEDALPFPDAFFDLASGGAWFGGSRGPQARCFGNCGKCWRRRARLLIVAANRASLWAQIERSPFGHGRPFSRSELDHCCAGAIFVPEEMAAARSMRRPSPAGR